ncbi:MAG: hypothetical protein Q4B64_04730 [Spirochaetales bacterium]|nr:hypothetical protein [Spirochaetales bacterium]
MKRKSELADKHEKWGQKYLVTVDGVVVFRTNDFEAAKACMLEKMAEGNKYTNLINTTIDIR